MCGQASPTPQTPSPASSSAHSRDIDLPVSKITGGRVEPLFVTTVLGKHAVRYYRCVDTGFIQTEEPYWLQEAYAAVICPLDVGYMSRSIDMSRLTAGGIARYFDANKRFLDYGGGSGVLARLMRDAGYDFFRCDPYCANLFAPYFDYDPATAPGSTPFELLTAFEVFEHLPNPMQEIEKMFALSDSILFSTELQPADKVIQNADDWHYFCPEHGQHIAFQTLKSLTYIANRFGAALYSDGRATHLLTRRRSVQGVFQSPLYYASARPTLQPHDHAMIMAKIREGFRATKSE
jgi:hypothetical protein